MHRRLLIVHPGALGDIVLAFPAILALRCNFQTIDILCQSSRGELAVSLGIADFFLPFESRDFMALHTTASATNAHSELKSYDEILLFSGSAARAYRIENVPLAC